MRTFDDLDKADASKLALWGVPRKAADIIRTAVMKERPLGKNFADRVLKWARAREEKYAAGGPGKKERLSLGGGKTKGAMAHKPKRKRTRRLSSSSESDERTPKSKPSAGPTSASPAGQQHEPWSDGGIDDAALAAVDIDAPSQTTRRGPDAQTDCSAHELGVTESLRTGRPGRWADDGCRVTGMGSTLVFLIY